MRTINNPKVDSLQEKNKSITRQMVLELDEGLEERLATVDKYFTPDCVWHSPSGDTIGHEALKEHYKDMDNVFSNVQHNIVQIFAEGDFVITHYQINLKHTGDFLGIPATGKNVQFPLIEICRFDNDKIEECWSDYDALLTMVMQLGAEIKYKKEVHA